MLFRFVEASGGGFFLNDPTIYGQDVPLPVPVVGIPDPARRDLSGVPAFGKADGFWPIEFDGTTAGEGQEIIWTYSLDTARKAVPAKGTVQTIPVEPDPDEGFRPISKRQFFQALAMPPYAIIQPQEALDAGKTGELPAKMQVVIDALPDAAQFAATMAIAAGTEFYRDHPLVTLFGQSQGMSEAQIDEFWRFAEGV